MSLLALSAAALAACTPSAAEEAVLASEPLVQAIRKTGAVMEDQEIFDIFRVQKLFCEDLTGDKRPEMTVFLDCCSEVAPTPLAIFRQRGGEWRLAYRSTRLLISDVKRKGRTLRLRHPVYRRTDAPCCPSSVTRYVVRYEDGAFVRHSRAST